MSTNIQKSHQDLALEMAQGQSSFFHGEWVLRALREQGILSSASILDFGAGRGNFLSLLSQEGFSNLKGMDLLAAPEPWKDHWCQVDLNRISSEKLKNQFDVIVAIEVIEHLENPRQMLRDFFEMLKPGGVFVITTPNVESLRSLLSLLVRGHYVDFLDSSYPAHITPVLSMDLHRIGSEAGFKNLQVQFSGRGALPFLTGLRWQSLSFDLFRGRRTSDHVMLTGRKSP